MYKNIYILGALNFENPLIINIQNDFSYLYMFINTIHTYVIISQLL